MTEPTKRCFYCTAEIVEHGGYWINALHKELTCHESPSRTHTPTKIESTSKMLDMEPVDAFHERTGRCVDDATVTHDGCRLIESKHRAGEHLQCLDAECDRVPSPISKDSPFMTEVLNKQRSRLHDLQRPLQWEADPTTKQEWEQAEAALDRQHDGKALRAALSPSDARVVRQAAGRLSEGLWKALDAVDDLLEPACLGDGTSEQEKRALRCARVAILEAFRVIKVGCPDLAGLTPAEALGENDG